MRLDRRALNHVGGRIALHHLDQHTDDDVERANPGSAPLTPEHADLLGGCYSSHFVKEIGKLYIYELINNIIS